MCVNPKPSVLIIDCHPEPLLEKLAPYVKWLEPHFEVSTVYFSQLESTEIKEDAAVVTGSEWQILKVPVPSLMQTLYREIQKPLLGICWGHQTLARAWGASITSKPFIQTIEKIRVLKRDEFLKDMGECFYAFESHYEHVVADETLLAHFDVLANSASCEVEAIRHKSRPLYGTQFHLERSGELCLAIARNFADIVERFHAL